MKTYCSSLPRLLGAFGAVLLLFLLPAQNNAQIPCIYPAQIDPNGICPTVYDPVCGCNGVTYGNSCEAFIAGVTGWTPGACVPNTCEGHCFYDVKVDLQGIRMRASLTPILTDTPFFFYVIWSLDGGFATGSGLEFNQLIAEPGIHTVCATYPTGDFTAETCTVCKAFEVSASCVDSAQINLMVACPLAYIPVCGCDGVTYDNACTAYNYGGVTAWTPGVCGSVCNNLAIDFDGANTGGALTSWTFNDRSNFPGGQVSSWYWDFGNGQSSFEQNPNFNFAAPGDYEVCLSASGLFVDGTQCGGSICKTMHIGNQTFCIDSTLIDPNILCPAVYSPVCGCDGITYENECVAYYQNGVTSWTPGICPSQCINPAWIDTLAPCIEIYDPVCGCDDHTYDNECFALIHGVTSWTKGVCCVPNTCKAFFTIKKLPNLSVIVYNYSTNAEFLSLDFGDGQVYTGNFDSLFHTYTSVGTFQICLYIHNVSDTCSDVNCQLVEINNGWLSTKDNLLECSVQPNPTTDVISLKTPGAVLEKIIVRDVFGKTVLEQTLSGNSSTISLQGKPSGVYLLNILTDRGPVTRKIILQR